MILIPPGQAADIKTAPALLEGMVASGVIADKGDDRHALRALIFPSRHASPHRFKPNAQGPIPLDDDLYKTRNRIQRSFNKFKHFRRIVPRFDRRVLSFMAFLHLASPSSSFGRVQYRFSLRRVNTTKSFDDEREVDAGDEHVIEFVEAGEDTAEVFGAAEEALDFVAAAIHGSIITPRSKLLRVRRNHRKKPQVESEQAGLISLVGAIHDQGATYGRRLAPSLQEDAALRAITGLAGREGRNSTRIAHSRQPDESWWSILRGTFQWLAGRFLKNSGPIGMHLHNRAV